MFIVLVQKLSKAGAHTTEVVEILYFATHAIKENKAPLFQLEFEKAVLTYQPESAAEEAVTVQFHDEITERYAELEHASLAKLEVCIDAVKNNHQDILCGIEAASTHVHAVHVRHQSVPDAGFFLKNSSIMRKKKECTGWKN